MIVRNASSSKKRKSSNTPRKATHSHHVSVPKLRPGEMIASHKKKHRKQSSKDFNSSSNNNERNLLASTITLAS